MHYNKTFKMYEHVGTERILEDADRDGWRITTSTIVFTSTKDLDQKTIIYHYHFQKASQLHQRLQSQDLRSRDVSKQPQ